MKLWEILGILALALLITALAEQNFWLGCGSILSGACAFGAWLIDKAMK